jgi:ribosomal protein L11 methyltransferase (prmA)
MAMLTGNEASETYQSVRIRVCDSALLDSGVLTELLAEAGAVGFAEDDGVLTAYIPADIYSPEAVESVVGNFNGVAVERSECLAPRNWNELWESNFSPLLLEVGGRTLRIRASFHAPTVEGEELVIDPRMAFGTGHHATTRLMLEWLVGVPDPIESCLDIGCGSGILAILAAKRGAKRVVALDYDIWAVENARENAALNGVDRVEVLHADLHSLPHEQFQLVLANLTKNLLLDSLERLVATVRLGGLIAMSGFYEADALALERAASSLGLRKERARTVEGWEMMVFSRTA